MTLSEFNSFPEKAAFEALFACCGSTKWAMQLAAQRSFSSVLDLKNASDSLWNDTNESDWLEAFTHHPKIGDTESLKKKFASTAEWASSEQSSVKSAGMEVLENLAKGNHDYEQKFGFIFIVCATGKSASEMLDLLQDRLPNSRKEELKIAAIEQHKITNLRIDKLFI